VRRIDVLPAQAFDSSTLGSSPLLRASVVGFCFPDQPITRDHQINRSTYPYPLGASQIGVDFSGYHPRLA
jgi:hypothetical protein